MLMKFNKYSAIYRNDDLKIDSEEVSGKTKDIKEYFRYELASQCMSDVDYENLIFNAKMIIYFIEDLEESGLDDNTEIRAYLNPMGAIQCEK